MVVPRRIVQSHCNIKLSSFFGCLFLEMLPGLSLLGGVSLINHLISLMVGHWG